MKTVNADAALGGVLVALTLSAAATAQAAAPDAGSVEETVSRLNENGYRVIVNKIGDAPLGECTVAAMRPGTDITKRVTDSGGDSIDVVQYTTVYLDVQC